MSENEEGHWFCPYCETHVHYGIIHVCKSDSNFDYDFPEYPITIGSDLGNLTIEIIGGDSDTRESLEDFFTELLEEGSDEPD